MHTFHTAINRRRKPLSSRPVISCEPLEARLMMAADVRGALALGAQWGALPLHATATSPTTPALTRVTSTAPALVVAPIGRFAPGPEPWPEPEPTGRGMLGGGPDGRENRLLALSGRGVGTAGRTPPIPTCPDCTVLNVRSWR
jgi:hypothetical protein